MRQRLPLLLALVLCGCQSAPTRVAPPAVPPAAAVAIRGTAIPPPSSPARPGAMLDVHLIDDRGETVAAGTFGDLHGPPYAFELPYDAAKIDATRHYALRAALRDAGGHLESATEVRVPIVPGGTQRVELPLVRSALAGARR